MPEYEDFELIVQSKGNAGVYSVFASGPAGQDSGEMVLAKADYLQNSTLENMGMTPGQNEALKSIGRMLFDLLFPDPVERLYERSRDGRRLRLKLIVEPPELRSLHWEYLYDYRHDEFPALSSNTALLRHVPLSELVKPVSVQGPLRILVLIAAPSDMPALDVAGEKALIQKELAELIRDGRVEIDIAEGEQITRCSSAGTETLPYGRRIATPAGLQDLLREDYHAFHYIGHGEFNETSCAGLLALEDETTGRKHLMSADTLRVLFHDASIKLAVLNGCETGASSGQAPFLGLAPALIKAGVPAVVAMQFPIADATALSFARSFYGALADNYPVDAAVSESRKAIFAKYSTRRDWGIPVLFMRSPDGVLWKMDDVPGKSTSQNVEPSGKHGPETSGNTFHETTKQDNSIKEENIVPISNVLHGKLMAFFTSIPDINVIENQRSLIKLARLDLQLVNMLTPNAQPSIFFPLVLSTMEQYGRLEDGRNPILAVLKAAKSFVGPKGKEDSENLIKALKGEGVQDLEGSPAQPASSNSNHQTGGSIVNNITIGNGANIKGLNIGDGNMVATDVNADGDVILNRDGNVEVHKNAGPPVESKEDMLEVLKQMQEFIAGLDIESRRTKKVLDDAVEEAIIEIEEPTDGKEPDKQTIASHLQKAADTLKTAGATAAQAVAFGQLVGQAATWLGPHADGLLKLLGL